MKKTTILIYLYTSNCKFQRNFHCLRDQPSVRQEGAEGTIRNRGKIKERVMEGNTGLNKAHVASVRADIPLKEMDACIEVVSPFAKGRESLLLLRHRGTIYLSSEACIPRTTEKDHGPPLRNGLRSVMQPDPFSLFYGNNAPPLEPPYPSTVARYFHLRVA